MIVLILAIISINLGVFNLLPFPALDGGRFFFMIISKILAFLSRNKMSIGKVEQSAHLIGFALLMHLSIFVAYQDIMKLFQ